MIEKHKRCLNNMGDLFEKQWGDPNNILDSERFWERNIISRVALIDSIWSLHLLVINITGVGAKILNVL